ncbi:MAG: helix-turn-helix domain-containing protein, partial [Ilumatobacteraceae bacterium]
MAFRPLHTARELSDPASGSDFDPTAQIGDELRGLRKAHGLTLKQVAAGAGISVGYLSEIERNLSRLP